LSLNMEQTKKAPPGETHQGANRSVDWFSPSGW